MHKRLAQHIRNEMDGLVTEYDARLRVIPGYAELTEPARHDLECQVLELMAACLETNDDQPLIDYVYARASQVLAAGFEVDWFQQAVAVPEAVVGPLVQTVAESNFVWKAINRAQQAAWQVVVAEHRQTEYHLQESEMRFRVLFEKSADAYLIIAGGLFVDCNQATVEMMRAHTKEEMLAVHLSKLSPEFQPDGRRSDEKADEMMRLALECGSHRFEWIHRKVDGEDFPVEVLLTPIVMGGQQVIFTVWRDITERKRAEQAIQESEQRFRTVADFTHSWETWLTPEGRYIYVSPACQRISGYTPQEFIGRPELFVEIAQPEDRALVESHVRDHSTTAETEPLEFRILTKDGHLRWISHVCLAVHDAAGNFQGRRGSNSDITARKRAQEAIRESQQRLSLLVESSPLAVIEWNLNFEVVSWNPAAERIFGYTAEEARGRHAAGLIVPAEYREAVDKVWTDLLTQQGGTRSTNGNVTKDGQAIMCEWFNTPLVNAEGRVFGVSSLVEDITERQRLETDIRESLERRGRQVQTSTEIAQEIAAAPELGELFKRVVTLIKERFGYYHAQLFRYDPARDAVVLVAGYGEAGRKMLAANHQLTMGRGLVGTAAATGQSLLASDVTQDQSWQPNPNLPRTKGELAVPITIGSGDAETQLHTLRYFTDSDFDGFAVTAINPAATAHIAGEAVRRDKAVVVISINLGPDNQSSFIGADNYQMGYLLGAQAGAWAREHVAAGEWLKLGMLNYRVSQDTIQREDGILDGIRAIFGPQVEVVTSGSAVEAATATSLTQAWLKIHPELHMIVSINDDGALGAYSAARAAGYHDPAQFFIGGIDGVPSALAAIQEGSVYQATVNQPPEILGILLTRVLIAKIKGLPVKSAYLVKCTAINRHNVASYLGPNREAVLLAELDETFATEELEQLDGTGLRLGLSVINLANPFFTLLANSAQKEAWRLGAQLFVNDPRRILGVLDVQSDTAGTLGPEDQLLLEGLCGQIAVALESTRLLEQLRRSEAQVSEALKIAKLAYWEYDVEKDLFLFNDQFYALFHTTAEQVGGYRISSAQYAGTFVYPDDLPIVGVEIERALNSTDQHYNRNFVHRIQYADGGVGYISVDINIDRDENGKILRYYGANQDITERQQAEEELRNAQQFLDSVLENLPIMVFVKEACDLRFVRWNKAGEELVGFSREDMVSKNDYDFFPKEEAEFFTAKDREVLSGKILVDTPEEPIQTRYHGLRLLHTRKIPILDAQGNPQYLLGISEDITERKQAEEALRGTQHFLDSVLENLPIMVFVKEAQNLRFVRWNKAGEELVGFSREDMMGKNDYDFFPKEEADFFTTKDWEVLNGKILVDTPEEPIQTRYHGLRLLHTRKIPILDEQGNPQYLLGISEDITERKAFEKTLTQERQLLRTLIDNLPDLVFVKDRQSNFLINNVAHANLFGHTPEEILGKSDFDFFPHELAERYFADEQALMQEGRAIIDLEEPSVDATGRPKWHLGTKLPLRDENGKVSGLVGVVRDITARKQAEAELERLLANQQKRTLQLQTAAEVSRAASSILNVDELLPQAAELIRARFGLYYVGIFLLDESRQWARLRAGTGEAGQQMLAAAHQLKIGGTSMISLCVTNRAAQIALDVGEAAIRFDNPLLPMTRSEAALPLISRGQPIGAITIQSDQPAAFSPDDVTILQNMADQISNAVENARLYEQARAALAEVDATNRRLTGETWESYLRSQAGQDVICVTDDEQAAPAVLLEINDQLSAGEITLEPDHENQDEAIVTAPIVLRGQPIGALRLRTPLDDWNKDLQAILGDMAGHIAQAVENARLVEQTQRTASRERAINEINARMRRTIDLDTILQTAVTELGQTLKAARVVARVGVATAEGRSGDSSNAPHNSAPTGGRGEKA